jgi:hypothetical protein
MFLGKRIAASLGSVSDAQLTVSQKALNDITHTFPAHFLAHNESTHCSDLC